MYIVLIITHVIVAGSASGQVNEYGVVIGDPNSSSFTTAGPVNSGLLGVNLIPYRSEILFTAGEIGLGGPGSLKAVDFILTGTLADLGLLSGANVYIKEVAATSLSNGSFDVNPANDGYTLVANGFNLLNVTLLGSRGVVRVALNTPFEYSGTSSLSIRIVQTGLLSVSLGRDFRTTDVSPDRFKRSSTVLGIPVAAVPSVDGRPVTRLLFDIAEDPSLTTSTITASPTSIAANGSATSTITVQLRDEDDNLYTASGGTVTLSTTAGSLSAVTDNGNGTYTATLTAPTTVGAATVSGALNGSPFTDTAVVTFVAGPPSGANSSVSVSPNNLEANGTSTSTITVILRDAFNNPITSGGATVALNTNLGTIGSVTDNGNGTYTATYTAPNTTGTATITGTVNGQNLPPATILIGPGAGSAAHTLIEASPSTLTANGTSTSTITVTVRDVNNNPVGTGGEAVSLSATTGTIGSVTDNGNGTYTATYTAPNTIGTATVSGILNGTPIVDTAEIVLQAGPPTGNNSSVAANPTSLVANGSSTSTLTVTLRDQYNNLVTLDNHTVTASATLGSVGTFTKQPDGTYTATYTSGTQTGTATITPTVNGQSIAPVNITLTPGAPSMANSTVSAIPNSLTADGLSTSTVIVTVRDANNNPVPSGATVQVNATLGSVGPVTNAGSGNYVAEFTAGTTAGIANITTSINSTNGPSTTIQLNAPVPSGENSTISVNPATVPADGTSTSTVTVTVRDANGNPITTGGATVQLSTNLGTLSSVSDNGDGTYTATFTAPMTTGAATISGTVNGQAMEPVVITVGAGVASPATTLISANPTTLIANGTSTSTVTVTLRDTNGNPVPNGGPVIALSASTGLIGAVTDHGDGTYTATYTSPTSTAGSPALISGTLDGTPITSTASITLTPGAASAGSSSIAVSPSSVLPSGTSTVTVTVRDANGNPVAGFGGLGVTLNPAGFGTVGSFTDNGDGTYTATYTAPATTGSVQLTAVVGGVNVTPPATITVANGTVSPTNSTLSASPTSFQAGADPGTTLTLTLRDADNNPVTGLSLNEGSFGSTNGGSFTVVGETSPGSGVYTATFTSTQAGQTTLSYTGVTQTVVVTVTSGSASAGNSSIAVAPSSVIPGGTSTVTVTVRDANNNPVAGFGGLGVTLDPAGFGTVGAFTDNGDGTYTATYTAPATTGSVQLTAVVGGVNVTPPATITVTPGAPSVSTSTVTAAPTTLTADGASTSTITVRLRDANGNNLTTGGQTVTVFTTAGTLSTVTDNSNGTYTATLTAPTTVQTATITARLGGVLLSENATVSFVAGAPSAAASTVTANPLAITANGSSTSVITVQLRDAQGNEIMEDAATVVLSTNAGTLLGSVQYAGSGRYTQLLQSSTSVETATVTGTLNGAPITDNATVSFEALPVGPPSAATSLITANPTAITANGLSTSTVTVQLRDASGNTVTEGAATVALATTAGSLSTVSNNGDGTYTATLTSSTVATTATITGTLNGVPIADNATVAFQAGPASLANTTITVNPTSLVANGTATSIVTVTVRDANNNPVTTPVAITLNATLGTLSAVQAGPNGTYTATFTAPTTTGTALITGTLDGQPIPDDATIALTPGTPSTATTTVTANPAAISANGTSTSVISVQLRDANGNLITTNAATVALQTTGGTLVGSAQYMGNGRYTQLLRSPDSPGTAVVTATINGNQVADDATVAFEELPVGPPSLATTTITADPLSISADGVSTSTITVQLRDAAGNLITEGVVSIALSTTAGSLSAVTNNGDGTYTATLTSSTTPGTATISGTLNGEALENAATVVFEEPPVGPPSAETSIIAANPNSIPADGVSTSTITVQLRDANGRAVTAGGIALALTTTAGTLSSVADNADGTYTATLTSSTAPGTATVRGTLAGVPMEHTASVNFTLPPPGPPSTLTSTLSAVPDSIIADGMSTSTITLTLRDASGRRIMDDVASVSIATTHGSIGMATYAGAGTYTATLTSPTSVGSAIVSAQIDGQPLSSTATVIFISDPTLVDAHASSISADPTMLPADGVSTSTLMVTLRNADGQLIGAGGHHVVFSASRGSVGSVADNGDGTYTATFTAGNTPGVAVIRASVDEVVLTDDAIIVLNEIAVNDPQPDLGKSFVVAMPGALPSDGTSTSTIRVFLIDSDGNHITGGQHNVTINASQGDLGPVTRNADGSYQAILTAPAAAGEATVTASLGGNTIGSVRVVFYSNTPGVPSPVTSMISAEPVSLPADGMSTALVTVTLRDADGTMVSGAGAEVSLSTTLGSLSTPVLELNGTFTARLTSSTVPGTAVITGVLNGVDMTDDASVLIVGDSEEPGDRRQSVRGNIFSDADGSDVWEINNEVPLHGAMITLQGTTAEGAPVFKQTSSNAAGEYVFTQVPDGFYSVAAKADETSTQSHPSRVGLLTPQAFQHIEMVDGEPIGFHRADTLAAILSDGEPGWLGRTSASTDFFHVSGAFTLDRNGDGVADGSIQATGSIVIERGQPSGSAPIVVTGSVTSIRMTGRDDQGNLVRIMLDPDVNATLTIRQTAGSREAATSIMAGLRITTPSGSFETSGPVEIAGTALHLPLFHSAHVIAEPFPVSGPGGSMQVIGARLSGAFGLDFGFYQADHGSAPISYRTRLRDDGARHIIVEGGPRFGDLVHPTAAGTPGAPAADEDGIVLGEFWAGNTASAEVTVVGSGYVNAWADFNRNGKFDDHEKVVDNLMLNAGTHSVDIDVPMAAMMGSSYVRFRISSEPLDQPFGLARDGEVEDYPIQLQVPGNTVSGMVFTDMNVNMVFDGDDEPLAEVTVYADVNGNGVRDQGEPSATTDMNGRYRILLPGAGTFTIRVLEPEEIDLIIGQRVVQLNANQVLQGINFVAAKSTSDDSEVTEVPTEFRLDQNYPNPFNPSTTIRFSLPESAEVSITVHDILGRVVTTVTTGYRTAGVHSVVFDASRLASGTYLYRIVAGSFVQTKKMTLVK